MKLTPELSLEEGIREAIAAIEKVNERPILVAVYGIPDSGKSYLIDRIGDYFKERNLSVGKYAGTPGLNTFERFRDRPESVCDLLLFHCGWDCRLEKDDDDPNYLAENIAGRKVHLNIGIYNPNRRSKPEGDYDLIISNPDSTIKIVNFVK